MFYKYFIHYQEINKLKRGVDMARTARKRSGTGIYHVLLRTRCNFLLSDEDREYFHMIMKKYLCDDSAALYGYNISSKRVHLLIDAGKNDISEIIKPFCTSYARYFNRVHSVVGSLFEGRFKSEPIDSDKQLAEVLKYLYRENPPTDEFSDNLKKIDFSGAAKILAMDDYENMPNEELLDLINYVCTPEILSSHDAVKIINEIRAADTDSRLRIGRIIEVLDLKKPLMQKNEKTQENQTSPNPKKKELSVWLL